MAVFTAIGASIFGAGTFMAAVTAAGLQIAAGVAINLIAKSIAGESDAQQGSTFGVQGKLQASGTLPRTIMLGLGATAGSLVYANNWGATGQYSNAYMTQVICVGDMPVNGLAQVWVNGELVTLDGSPHASMGYPVLQYRKDGSDHLWIKFYDGTQTTADGLLTGTVSSADRPYASTRVGKGCPYVIATALVNETLFTSGFPSFKFALNGVKLYDISKDDTAGGDGDHRYDTPSTWGGDGDHLPAVQAYNLLRGMSFGGEWLYGLQNLPAARLPADHWIAQIEKCRALIAGPDGDEATYRSGGEISVNAPIADAIEALLTSCQGRLAEIGGVYKIYVGEPGEAVFAFDDGDIISTEEQSFTPFFGLSDTINGISARHPSPAEGWAEKVAPPLYNADYEALDGNRRLMADVSLDLVPYPGQVQRLMKSALAEGRRARRHTFVLPPDAFVLEPGDVIRWSSERNGYEDKLFRVDGIVDRANLDLMVDITEVDPADYDWDQETDYVAPIDGPLVLVRPAPQPIVDWAVFRDTIYDDDSNARRATIRIEWNGNQPDVRAVAFKVRRASTEAVEFSGEVLDVLAGQYVLPPVLLPNTTYEVQGRYVPASPRDTEWSEWLSVTTENIKLGVTDIQVELGELAKDVLAQQAQIRTLVERFKQMGTLLEESDRENFTLRNSLNREISIQLGNLTASFSEVIEVALGPGGAVATRIDALYAAMGGNSAQINTRWNVEATEDGYGATYGLQLAVDADGLFRAATMFADVPTDTDQPTRWGFLAGQFVWFTSAGVPLVAMNEDGRQVSANGVKVIDWVTGAESTTIED